MLVSLYLLNWRWAPIQVTPPSARLAVDQVCLRCRALTYRSQQSPGFFLLRCSANSCLWNFSGRPSVSPVLPWACERAGHRRGKKVKEYSGRILFAHLCKGLMICSVPSVGFLVLTTGSCARNSGRRCRSTGRFFNDSSVFALSTEILLLLLDLLKLLSLVTFSLAVLRLKKKPCARAPGPYSRSTRCWMNDFSLLDEVFNTWLSTSVVKPFRILASLNKVFETAKTNV